MIPFAMTASVSMLCGMQWEALSLCTAYEANVQCSSCLSVSGFLIDPVDGTSFGTCESLRSQICLTLESHWSSCACNGFCEAELEDFYQCSMLALTDGTLNCDDENLRCFGALSTQSEVHDQAPTEHSNQQRKLQGPIQGVFEIVENLLAAIGAAIFGIFDPDQPDFCSCDDDVDDPPDLDSTFCSGREDNLNKCLEDARTSEGSYYRDCYECIKESAGPGLFPESEVLSSSTCGEARNQTCSSVKSLWTDQCRCIACAREADCYYGCLIEDITREKEDLGCSDDLDCVCIPTTAESGPFSFFSIFIFLLGSSAALALCVFGIFILL